MRAMWRLLLLFVPALLVCQTILALAPGSSPTPALQSTITPIVAPRATNTAPPLAVTPTPTLTLPEASPLETISETAFAVRYHPDGGLYVGDLVSMEVIAPRDAVTDLKLNEAQVLVEVDGPSGTELEPTEFGRFGIGGRRQATLFWIWDTFNLDAGDHTLTFSIQPDGPTWTETVTLNLGSTLPFPEPEADWDSLEIDCCVIHFITGTAAERDIDILEALADQQAEVASQRLRTEFADPIPVVLVPRVLGHGGFAGDEIYISYLDRNYAGTHPAQVLHHEMIHILDGRLGGDLRPSLFTEGLAVYLSKGHFKPEPLMLRTAHLLDLGWYLPLAPLADNFYPSQHEISYMEASALVEYMVQTWGWEAFSAFYRDIHPHPSGLQSKAIDVALQDHFGLTFAELEADFQTALRSQPRNPDLENDVRLTVQFFDTLRRYQQALDNSAYYLAAWLPNGGTMRGRGIVADYLRHPVTPENMALEMLLVAANGGIRAGRIGEVGLALAAVNAVLDRYKRGDYQPFHAHPLAADYLALVLASLERGYTPQRIHVNKNMAEVWASKSRVKLVALSFVREDLGWTSQ